MAPTTRGGKRTNRGQNRQEEPNESPGEQQQEAPATVRTSSRRRRTPRTHENCIDASFSDTEEPVLHPIPCPPTENRGEWRST